MADLEGPPLDARRCLALACAISLATFRNHGVAAMFCIPCERAWTVSTRRPLLAETHRNETDRS